MSRAPEYKVWRGMHRRCFNKNDAKYHSYGGRGITIDPRWLGPDGFLNFLADVGTRPSVEHSLDRKNNDGPYSKENCRWTTRKVQGSNKQNTVHLTYKGETLHLAEWSRRLGLDPETIAMRLSRGWSAERALTTPARHRTITYDGETRSLAEWARLLGMPFGVLRYRINFWGLDRAMMSAPP
jgi:hypothetical protein